MCLDGCLKIELVIRSSCSVQKSIRVCPFIFLLPFEFEPRHISSSYCLFPIVALKSAIIMLSVLCLSLMVLIISQSSTRFWEVLFYSFKVGRCTFITRVCLCCEGICDGLNLSTAIRSWGDQCDCIRLLNSLLIKKPSPPCGLLCL